MSTKKRVFIAFDGSNFYNRLKEPPLSFKNLLVFDFSNFVTYLLGDNLLVDAIYYVGAIRTEKGNPKSYELYKNQRRFLGYLEKQKITVSRGYILKNDGYHEKGVDVNIAVDILVAAYENLCDRIILVSSDTDLLPAIKKAKEKGKVIEYIGFSHQPSLAMVANCSESTLLKKEDLVTFVKK